MNSHDPPWWERNGEPPPEDRDAVAAPYETLLPPELRGEVLDPNYDPGPVARHVERLRRRASSPVDASASDIYTDPKAQNDLIRSIAAAMRAKDSEVVALESVEATLIETDRATEA